MVWTHNPSSKGLKSDLCQRLAVAFFLHNLVQRCLEHRFRDMVRLHDHDRPVPVAGFGDVEEAVFNPPESFERHYRDNR